MSTSQSFADLGVSRAVTNALASQGIDSPFAIQRDVIGDVLTQLDELTSLVADLAELARGEQPQLTTESIRLDSIVLEAVEVATTHGRDILGHHLLLFRAHRALLGLVFETMIHAILVVVSTITAAKGQSHQVAAGENGKEGTFRENHCVAE